MRLHDVNYRVNIQRFEGRTRSESLLGMKKRPGLLYCFQCFFVLACVSFSAFASAQPFGNFFEPFLMRGLCKFWIH